MLFNCFLGEKFFIRWITLHWTLMADDSNGRRPISIVQQWTFRISDVTWSQKPTLVYTLNPDLMHRYIIADVQMYRFTKVTIYLGFAFVVTIFDIFKLIIDYQVDH